MVTCCSTFINTLATTLNSLIPITTASIVNHTLPDHTPMYYIRAGKKILNLAVNLGEIVPSTCAAAECSALKLICNGGCLAQTTYLAKQCSDKKSE